MRDIAADGGFPSPECVLQAGVEAEGCVTESPSAGRSRLKYSF